MKGFPGLKDMGWRDEASGFEKKVHPEREQHDQKLKEEQNE